MSYPPPPLPPRYLWVPAPRAHRIRATCRRVAVLLITACLALIPLLAVFGGRLPRVHPALGVFSWALVGSSMLMVVLTGVFLFAARRHVSTEHLDLQEVGELRSGIVVAWTSSLFMTTFAFVGLSLGLSRGLSSAPLDRDGRDLSWPAVWVLVLLLATPLALTTIALVTGRRLFRPPTTRA
ncbi:hypothetical protein [Saccharothrix texasensis]|uniref:Uncharacterized protein n=1 Tax=Saccharothrix texasensis TaxID=103734 RepID=A0A3N1H5M1_9PSEU|nr:hypothetical protein [Saccharothrix texasensis]ROP37502.1 hypothetical protein EDD40_2815 [Saccharothrix texasensis]